MSPKFAKLLRHLAIGLGFVVGGLALGMGTGGLQPAQAAGNCAPGYPVCWFAAECNGQCWAYVCNSYHCDAYGSSYHDCYKCVTPE